MRGAVWSRWNWLEQAVIPAISALMYAAWLGPLLRLVLGSVLLHPRYVEYPWWAIITVLLGAVWLSHLLAERRWGRWAVAAIGLLVVLAAALAPYGAPSATTVGGAMAALVDFSQGVPAGLVVLLITLGLWFLGARARWDQHEQLMRGFLAGIVVLALLSLFAPGAVSAEDLVVFLLSGLLGLALLSVSRHLSYQAERGLPRPALSRYWLMALGLGVLGILLAGWLLSLLVAPEAVVSLMTRLRPLLAYMGQVIAFLGALVVWLLYSGYLWLARLFQTGPTEPPAEESALPPSYAEQLPELNLTPGTPPALPEGLGVILAALLLAVLVIYVIVRAWRRRSHPRYTATAVEEREYVWSADLLLERWRGLFDGLAPRRRAALFAEALDLANPRHRIRQAYRLLLLNARERGLARRRGQTVTNYRDALAQAVPPAQEALDILSAAYLYARYAPSEPPDALVQEAQRASEATVEQLVQPRRVGRREPS